MAEIMDGNKVAGEILSDLKIQVEGLDPKPRLDIILIGNNPESARYVDMKRRRAESIGIEVQVHHFDEDVKEDKIVALVSALNIDSAVTGIMIQLPVPEKLDVRRLLDTVNIETII